MKNKTLFATAMLLLALSSNAQAHESGLPICANHSVEDAEDTEGAPDSDQEDAYFPVPLHIDAEDNTPACLTTEEIAFRNGSQGAPVWRPFMRNLGSCAPGCRPVNFNAYRKSSRSCHNTGRALDVGAINCGGRNHEAIRGGKFASIVHCMQGKMRVLYRNGKGRTSGHHDHAHFSIGCSVPGHPNYW